ncbi:MAG: homoserine O-acetyltransferase [Chitinophagaceae bacterium]
MLYKLFSYNRSFTLESGRVLPGYHLAYTTHGALNASKDNVVWIFHALTANSDPAEWWAGLVGADKLFDPAKYFIVCVNMPGSCYGSLGPLDINPETGEPYYHEFPFFTTRDMVAAYQPLQRFLGIESIHIGIGGSMGGQQLLEWAVTDPSLFQFIFPIATNAKHSAWGIAINASQRMAIETDSSWKERSDIAGLQGMKTARSMALISYRSYDTYAQGQSEQGNDKLADFNSESYQRYQGEKLAKRFNAFSYYVLSMGMDAHNLGRSRASIPDALLQIKAKTLVIGVASDILFPLAEQQYLANHIPAAAYATIHSTYGHDGFLLEFEQISQCITAFLEKNAITEGIEQRLNAARTDIN